MINSKLSQLLLFVLASVFYSCQDDNETITWPELSIYLERFEQEAQKRGYDLDLSVVEAVYVDEIKFDDGNIYCGFGYSNYDGNGSRRIEISKTNYCNWAGRSDIERENLFFHEIGHAFFNRGHDNTISCDGDPLSIMIDDPNIQNPWQIYTEAESEKRDYYIAELLDRLTAVDQCIAYEKDWNVDPVFYNIRKDDNAWIFHSDDENYIGQRSPADFTNDEFLSIAASPESNTKVAGYWYRQFDNPNIPECAEVALKVTMNASQLTGDGAAIAIRAYYAPVGKQGAQTEEYLLLSTEDNPVAGQLTNHTEELVIPCFSRKTTHLVIFVVMMPGTEGEITFEDIQLLVKENSNS